MSHPIIRGSVAQWRRDGEARVIDLLSEHREEVEQHLRTLGWVRPDERVGAMAPAGEGNMNRTLRVTLDTRSIVLKQSVPFVAKYPQIAAPADRVFVEAAFYKATAEPPALAMRLPKVLGFDPLNRLLCLQDLGAAADFTDVYRGAALARGELTALLHWLGVLHSLTLDAAAWPDLENRDMRQLNHAHIFDIPLAAESAMDLDAITPGLARLRHELTKDTALIAKVQALGRIYLGQEPHPSRQVLLHGDYYPGSWLRDARAGVKIIDPEFAFLGPAEFDVGVMLAHLTFAGVGQGDIMRAVMSYNRGEGFSQALALGFAGTEIIRRLLGVAQLPLVADLATKERWLTRARQMVAAG